MTLQTYNYAGVVPRTEEMQGMKLQADRIEGHNAIARHGPGGVVVNAIEYRDSVVVPWSGVVHPWPVDTFEALTEAHFEAIAALEPELVIFGSGPRIRFAKPALLKSLIGRSSGTAERI